MPEIQKGVGVVWGISSTGITYTGSGTLRIQSQALSKSADEDETRNEAGEVVNHTTYNLREEISLTVVPSGATMAAAKASNIVPDPGEELKIIDTDLEIGASSPGKSYMVISASMNKTNNGKATIEITARRYAGISTYTPLSS